jgi:hypothetical protein
LRQAGIEVQVLAQRMPFASKNQLLGHLSSWLEKTVKFHRGLITEARSHARFLRERQFDLVNANNSITRH